MVINSVYNIIVHSIIKPSVFSMTLLILLIISPVISFADADLTTYTKEDWKKVIEVKKQAIKINPDDVDAHFSLGNAYRKLDMNNEAIESYKQVIKINPEHVEAYIELGTAYCMLDMNKEAREAFNQAIIINPDDAGAHLGLGIVYSDLDMNNEAIDE